MAASVGSPDEVAAVALEDAAQHARSRGALRPAALMLDRASELTPAERPEESLRRAVDAAYLHFESGDSRRAEAQLRALIAPLAPGPARARATVVLARIRLYEAPSEAAELFAQVVEEAGDDRETLAFAHEGVAASCLWLFERFEDVLLHSGVALSLAEEMGDEALTGDVVLGRLSAEVLLGLGTAPATAERVLALQDSAVDRRVMDQPLISLGEYWKWVDQHERARAMLLDLLRRAHEMGDENARPWLLFLLGDAERLLGNLDVALECSRDGRDAAEQSGQHLFALHHLALESLVEAQRGNPERAREAARHTFEDMRDNFGRMVAAESLGHLALLLRAPEDVVKHLEPRLAFVRQENIVEPGATRFVIDLIEALVELGRRDQAAEILGWYEGNALRVDRASARAGCLRCRGLLEAQAGDLAAALALFEEALTWHAKVDIPLDRGRTLLALGRAQRRAKQRREARATLEQALAVFERIGARLWAERARDELRRISGRAPSAGALTPAEERVAALVAEGKTNSEVAASLFLSDRTVEGHLSRIYAKLGIRHRTELGPALAARQTQGLAAPNIRDTPVSADSPAP